jgi:hypothetical protein
MLVNARRVLPLLIALVVILSGAAGLAAYESHVVNITARVEQRPLLEKYLVANPDLADLPVQPPADCFPGDSNPPVEVPGETCVWWVMRIAMSNPFNVALETVVITDRFGAELDGQLLSDVPVNVEVITHTRGQSKKESFETQVRITWCVTGDLLPDGTCFDGQLEPGDSAYLDLLVYTNTNPSGRQEYTEMGTYEMNSGATAKWVDPDGVQCGPLPNCPTTPSLEVEVLAVDEGERDDLEPDGFDETPTPEPTEPPEPAETPTPEPTESPEPAETPTPEPTQPPEPAETPTPEPTEPPEPAETPTPEPTEPVGSATELPAESDETETPPQPWNRPPELSGITLR